MKTRLLFLLALLCPALARADSNIWTIGVTRVAPDTYSDDYLPVGSLTAFNTTGIGTAKFLVSNLLQKSNNLSELSATASTVRTNLGLVIGTNVAPATSGAAILYGNGAGGSSSVGYTGGSLAFSGGNLTLSGDSASPGNSYMYATNSGGVKGWQQETSVIVTHLAGTSNQITASGATGSITLSLPSTFVLPGSLSVTSTVNLSAFAAAGTIVNGTFGRLYSNQLIDAVAYGADNTGATDSTTAISNAIAACPAYGTVLLSPGTYKMTSQCTIAQSNVTIMGYGAQITSDTAAHCRKFAATSQSNVRFLGIQFDGDYPSGGPGLGDAFAFIELTTCTDCYVQDCTFQNTEYSGIFIQGACARITVSRNTFSYYYCGVYGQSSGTTAQPVQLNISGNQFKTGNGTTSTNFTGAIKIVGLGTASGSVNYNIAGANVVANNTIFNPGQMGVELNGSVNTSSVTGNTVYNAGFGVSIAMSAGDTVVGNTIQFPQAFGVEIAASSANVTCTGNSIEGLSTTGGSVTTAFGYSVVASNNVTITGGFVENLAVGVYAQDSSGTPVVGLNITGLSFGPGIVGDELVIKDVQNWSVNGCNFTGGGTTYCFIAIDNVDGANNYGQIVNNRFTGATSNQAFELLNFGTNPITYLEVVGNDVTNSTPGSGWWFEGGGITSNLKYIRVHDNIDGGTNSNFSAIELHAYTVSSAFPMTTNRWYSLEKGIIQCNAAGGIFTVTLQSAVNLAGWETTIEKIDSSGNLVTVATTSSQTINGATTYTGLSAQYKRITVRSDGANWIILQSN